MNAVHPSPTAGDGKVIYQSHYIKKSDTLDRIIQCAQCGFQMNLQNRGQGASMGAIPEGSATQLTGTGTPPAPGISFTDYYADPVDTNSGCPFCNTMNPTAYGRGYTGFERPHKSVENL